MGQNKLALGLIELFSGNLDRALDMHRTAPGADVLVVYDLMALDRLDEALEVVDALDGGGGDVGLGGSGWNRATVRVNRAQVLFALGRLDEAEAEAEAAIGISRELDRVTEELGSIDWAYRIGVRRGLPRELDRRWTDLRGSMPDSQSANWGIDTGALLAASFSNGPENTGALFDLVMPSLDQSYFNLAVTPSVGAQLVTIALGLKDRDRAGRIVDRAEKLAAANPVVTSLGAGAAHARGLLDHDIGALQHAQDLAASSPRPLLRADIAHSLGTALEQGNRRRDAVARWKEALGIYEECGATVDAAAVRGRLHAVGVRDPTHRRPQPGFGWAALTDAELAVVRLVVEGGTNREVARRMFLSPHTVDSHLRHAFRKLDVSSRVELTRVAIENDRTPPD
jgi:DNA-binding CsgD family transcriptional regulator